MDLPSLLAQDPNDPDTLALYAFVRDMDRQSDYLTAYAGVIGSWNINQTSITSGAGANSVGLDSGGANPAFYAGSATPGSAPFRVTQAGVLTATSGTFSGDLNTAGIVLATGGYNGGQGMAAINGIPAAANVHGVVGWATGTGHGGIFVAGANGDGVRGISSGAANAGVYAQNNGAGNALTVIGPMSISSATLVANLNAQYLNGTLSGNSSGNTPVSNGTLCANLYAAKADILATARTIGSVSFDGSANITPIYTKQISGAAHTYAWTGGTVSGAATATFPGNDKPGGNTSNSWLTFVVDGTTFYVPAWL